MRRNQNLLEVVKSSQANPCLCFNLKKASRVISQLYDDALRPLDLRATQYAILSVVLVFEPVTFQRIADMTLTDKTTMARNLKILAKKDLIKYSEGADKREKEVHLTAKGRTLLNKAYPLWKTTQTKVYKKMGKNRVRTLLDQISTALPDIQDV